MIVYKKAKQGRVHREGEGAEGKGVLQTLDLRGIGGHRDKGKEVVNPKHSTTPHVDKPLPLDPKSLSFPPVWGSPRRGDATLRKHRHSFAVLGQIHERYVLDRMVVLLRSRTGARTVDWGTIMGRQYFWVDTSLEVGRNEDTWQIPTMIQELLDHGEEVYLTDGSRVWLPPFSPYSRRIHDLRRMNLMMEDAGMGLLRTHFTDGVLNAYQWRYPDDVEEFIEQAKLLDAQYRKAKTPRARRQVAKRAEVKVHPLFDKEAKLYRTIWKNGERMASELSGRQLVRWIKLQNQIALKWPSRTTELKP